MGTIGGKTSLKWQKTPSKGPTGRIPAICQFPAWAWFSSQLLKPGLCSTSLGSFWCGEWKRIIPPNCQIYFCLNIDNFKNMGARVKCNSLCGNNFATATTYGKIIHKANFHDRVWSKNSNQGKPQNEMPFDGRYWNFDSSYWIFTRTSWSDNQLRILAIIDQKATNHIYLHLTYTSSLIAKLIWGEIHSKRIRCSITRLFHSWAISEGPSSQIYDAILGGCLEGPCKKIIQTISFISIDIVWPWYL